MLLLLLILVVGRKVRRFRHCCHHHFTAVATTRGRTRGCPRRMGKAKCHDTIGATLHRRLLHENKGRVQHARSHPMHLVVQKLHAAWRYAHAEKLLHGNEADFHELEIIGVEEGKSIRPKAQVRRYAAAASIHHRRVLLLLLLLPFVVLGQHMMMF